MSTAGLVSLSDPECLDPSRVGAKAARLARARAAGLPVLPGIVVPVQASIPTLRDALSRSVAGGPHGVRLAVMDADVDPLTGLPDTAAELAATLVVRSSSPLEGTTRWSGAFTSLLDVRPEDVLTAVRGVWASAVGDDAVERTRRDASGPGLSSGQEGSSSGPEPPSGPAEAPDPAELGLAVLIQPQVDPEFSGTAEIGVDGRVTVVTVAGSPAPLVAGWDPGHAARCDPDGSVTGDAAIALAGREPLRAVAKLARAVRRELGDDLVEWAFVDGEARLLQTKIRIDAAARPPDTPYRDARSGPYPHAELPVDAGDVAHRVLRHAGPTGERLVLPWLLAGEPGPGTPGVGAPADEARTDWERAVHLAESLTVEAWAGLDDPWAEADRALAALRGDRAAEALGRLRALPGVDPYRAAEALALFGRVARRLVEAGALARPHHLWALPPDEVPQLLAGDRAADPQRVAHRAHRAVLRWEPFTHAAVTSAGTQVSGVPAAPGTGAGPVVFVAGPRQRTAPRPGATLPPRAVIVAARPLPHLAPLLWGASALVTFGGSTAAHLVEVARSLAVPAVVGCPAEEALGPHGPALAAVDGDRGTLAVHAVRAMADEGHPGVPDADCVW